MKLLKTLLPLSLLGGAQAPEADIVYQGGFWFDGREFISRPMAVRDGRFIDARNVQPGARTVDLSGGYVVPPFCEGHNHNIVNGNHEEKNGQYLNAGVFYVQILNNEPRAAQGQRAFWDRSDTADVAFSHGGITGAGGHPVEILEGIRRGGGYGPNAQIADKAYYEVDTIADLEYKWLLLREESPDIVKLFLQFSDEFEQRRSNPAFYGNRGISPEVFRRAMQLARRDGMRVAVHTAAAADFHLAVEEQADIIAHVPGYMSIETLSAQDAALAASHGIWVITTGLLAQTYPIKNVERSDLRAAQIANLRTLKAAGVPLAIGSDSWSDLSHREVRYLRELGIFDDRELLRMWTENCPRMIFPARQIGSLQTGYEASFLVLNGNPLTDFEAVRNIRMMVKNGVVREPAS